MYDDLKELRLVLNWRKRCQNREKWGKLIKPVTGKITKGELRSQGSRASGRLRERSGKVGPEVLVGGIKEQVKSDVLEEGNIEQVTGRHRIYIYTLVSSSFNSSELYCLYL